MSRELIRQTLVAAVESAKASFAPGYQLLIEYDNRWTIDTQTQTNPYLKIDIKFIDMEQADISNDPTHRILGQLVLGAGVKAGSGSKEANFILDHFFPRLQRKTFGTVRTHMATVAPDVNHLGWLYCPVIVPFWADVRYGL